MLPIFLFIEDSSHPNFTDRVQGPIVGRQGQKISREVFAIRQFFRILSVMIFSLFMLVFLLPVPGFLSAEEGMEELPAINPQEETLLELIFSRRSIRSYQKGFLTAREVGDLLWAGAGITIDGLTGATRAAPSAGGINPLILYVYLHEVEGFEPGLYRYSPSSHGLDAVIKEDLSRELSQLALNQSCVATAQLVILITAEVERTTARYGERGFQYVYMEVGHGAQNILLTAEHLGLGAVVVGAFYQEQLKEFFSLQEEPLLLIPVGLP